MDHSAADTSAVHEHLDPKNAVHIGHSTGGGQVDLPKLELIGQGERGACRHCVATCRDVAAKSPFGPLPNSAHPLAGLNTPPLLAIISV